MFPHPIFAASLKGNSSRLATLLRWLKYTPILPIPYLTHLFPNPQRLLKLLGFSLPLRSWVIQDVPKHFQTLWHKPQRVWDLWIPRSLLLSLHTYTGLAHYVRNPPSRYLAQKYLIPPKTTPTFSEFFSLPHGPDQSYLLAILHLRY